MENDSVTGGVRTLLRIEGFVVFAMSLAAYAKWGAGWWTFAVCFLIPDLSLLGYLAGPRAGAFLYNCAHSCVGALACLAAGVHLSAPWAISAGIIWVSHIGFDRALGYGLKYGRGFRYTHLGKIGRSPDAFATVAHGVVKRDGFPTHSVGRGSGHSGK